jgi:hypothetical protein
MPVTVKWGNDRFEFELPHYNTPLAAIRNSLAAYTHLPYHAFLIIHDGAVMKDDNAPSNFQFIDQWSTKLRTCSIRLQPWTKLYYCNCITIINIPTTAFQEYRTGPDIQHPIRTFSSVKFPFTGTFPVPCRSINTP